MFRESDAFQDVEWERQFCYKDIEVPDIYAGPHLSFPLTISNVTELVDAFKNKQVWSFLWKQQNSSMYASQNQHRTVGLNECLYCLSVTSSCLIFSLEASRAVRPAAAGQDVDASALDAQHQSRVHLQTQRDHHLWWENTSIPHSQPVLWRNMFLRQQTVI